MASRRSGAVRVRWVQSAENWAPTFRGRVHEPATQGGTGVSRRIVHGVFHVVSCQQLTHLVCGLRANRTGDRVGDVVVVELSCSIWAKVTSGRRRLSASNRRFLAAQSTRSASASSMHHAQQRPERGSTPIIVSIVVAGSELASASAMGFR